MKITDNISEDLKNRVLSGKNIPSSWTLAHLAKEYEVSLTPVRLAIENLISEKVIIKKSNGRLEPNQQLIGKDPKVAKSSKLNLSRQDNLEKSILSDLIKESLKQEEIFLREEAYADKFDVSRTIIRSHFNKIAGMGLLTHIERRGWKVRPYQEDDMIAFLEIRELLEVKALKAAKKNLDPKIIQGYIEKNSPSKKSKKHQLNDDFHQYIIDCSGNRYINEFFKQQGIYWSILFNFAAPELSYEKEMAQQHIAILSAILNKNWKQAEKELVQHIQCQFPIMKKLINKIK